MFRYFPDHESRRAGGTAHGRRGETAFTMVEIALCLAVIAFALVAIIGVLPTGLRVQKDNREDTIINQEGTFLLEAIRSQSPALDYLTNYFDTITVSNKLGVTVYTNKPGFRGFLPGGAALDGSLTNGQKIMELLSRPKYVYNNSVVLLTNFVSANVRAISGSAVDKSKLTRDFAFAYQLKSEVFPLSTYPPLSTNYSEIGLAPQDKLNRSNVWRVANNQAPNFSELRLTLQGPVIQKGKNLEVTGTPKSFRTVLSGMRTNNDQYLPIRPNVFVQVQ